MAQAFKTAETRQRTFEFQVITGSGALERTFIVELSGPMQRKPDHPQQGYLEQLRDAIRRPEGHAELGEVVVRSVREVNPNNGMPQPSSVEMLRDGIRQSMDEVYIAPIVRM